MRIYILGQKSPAAWELTSDEFVDYHKTRSIPPVKERAGVFKYYKKDNYDVLIKSVKFGRHVIEFRKASDPLWDSSNIVAFDGERAVGLAAESQDLQLEGDQKSMGDGVWVDRDYRGLGMGVALLEEFRKQFPQERRIGQMSPSGERMVRSYHRKMVLDAVENGLLTQDHPKHQEILDSIASI